MAISPYDGLYWDTHIPLGLHKTLRDQMGKSRRDPNTPNVKDPSIDRQWLSLPRGASSYKLKYAVYTFEDSVDWFSVGPNGFLIPDQAKEVAESRKNSLNQQLDYTQSGYGAQIARALDPNIFEWFPVPYNTSAFPLNVGVQAAVDRAVSLIKSNSSKVFLIGHGKGAVVASMLYEEFRTGRLTSRRSDLLGVFNFGNPMREAGHTIPGGIEVDGHGISPQRLSDTEELVWEFASPDDPLASTGDDLIGEVSTLLYTKYDTLITSLATLESQMREIINSPIYGMLPVFLPFRLAVNTGEGLNLAKLVRTLNKELFSDGGSHDQYQSFYPVAGSRRNAIETALVGIQNIALANPPVVVNASKTEVLTINYRKPVSISEISFEILKKSCYTEVWYLDRQNNWRQMIDENSSPIAIRIAHAEGMEWYKFSAYTYPIVAQAVQFRISRIADPLYVGDAPYCVGIRNTLIRRNVYNRSAGLQGMEDEVDALGNIVSKVIKDWDASKATDDNPATFWRSFPQPDPDAVVNFYLDTRDSEGNAQLIDKIYLDPVYTGQSLNLYYSNDGTVTSKKLNPASLIPVFDYQIGIVKSATGNGSTATITIDTIPSVVVGDSITVTQVSPMAYNGTYTVSAVSLAQKTISFSSTATGSLTAEGIVTTKGQDNFRWVMGSGLKDDVPLDTQTSIYRCPFGVGPMVSQDCWIGIQWTPSFRAYDSKEFIGPISTKSVSKSGNTATLELSAAPNVSVGQSISLIGMSPNEYNGTHTVIASSNTAPYNVQFSTSATGEQLQPGSVITNNFSPGIEIATTAATGNGATVTLTVASNPKVVVGDIITVSGLTPTGYNGTYTVTAASSSAPYTISYASSATGAQTVAGKVATNTKVKVNGASSLSGIHSVYDSTTKELIYNKYRDESYCTFNNTTKTLRIPAGNASLRCLPSDNVTIYLGTNGPAPGQLDLFEVIPESATGDQCWPRIYYDSATAQIVLQIFKPNAATPLLYPVPLNTLFDADTPINIVVGWRYIEGSSPMVYVSACTNRQVPVAFYEQAHSDFPTKISLNGKIGAKQWRGTFGAHVVKQESYSLPTANQSTTSKDFLANPVVYCNPDPVLIAPNSTNTPANSLDNAIMAVDWTTQQFAAGGAHSSSYSDKEWTPIWVNYFAEKGFLHLPETTAMKYLKMEFSQLTPEPYPVYDQGIKVMYQVYPVTITQTSAATKSMIGNLANVFGGIGSVNWLNPSTVNNATNSIFGRTVQPVQTQIQIGPGYTTDTLPNTTQTAIADATRDEVNSPWIYRRTPINPFSLAKDFLRKHLHRDQTVQSWVPNEQLDAIESQTDTTKPTTSSQPLLPIQGQDWYVFPGQTLRMPANVVEGVTRSQVVTTRRNNKSVRTRFTTTAVHQYEVKTVTLDANIAYFAGIREVQPYTVTYLDDSSDLPEFRFDTYDSTTGWTAVNVQKVGQGSVTAKPNPYAVLNSRFNASINYWTGEGWDWDTSKGHTLAENWQPGTPFVYGSAHATADGTNLSLVSEPVDVDSGASINFTAWAVYKDITYDAGAKIFVDAIGLDADGNVVASSINLGEHMQIAQGTNSSGLADYYFFDVDQPCSSVPQVGVEAIPLYGTVDLSSVSLPSGSNPIRKIQVRLNINSSVTGGDVWFDDVDMAPTAGIVGSVNCLINTKSKFSRVKCKLKDSGVKRSDPMWAYVDSNDPRRRMILAHYVSTSSDILPDQKWSDSVGTWEDKEIKWGAPKAVVSISYSEAIYDKKRVIHFYRKSATLGEQVGKAGIVVRQELNFVPGSLFRICATFFKERETENSMLFSLARVSGREDSNGTAYPIQSAASDNRYPNGLIHEERLGGAADPNAETAGQPIPTGYWHTHQGQWIEVPGGQDQVYKVALELSGVEEDDIYLNDLWVEIAHVRYHVQLGGGINHDITPLINKDTCTVGTTEPVNQMEISIEMHGSTSFLIAGKDSIVSDEKTILTASMSTTENPTHLSGFDQHSFTTDDVGKYIWVQGAGVGGKNLKTSIVGVVDGKAVLESPCSTTVTNAKAVFATDDPAVTTTTGQTNSYAYSSVFTPLYLQ